MVRRLVQQQHVRLIQDQLRQISGLPVSDVRTMDEVISRSTSRQRFNMILMSIFGGSALFLAAIGVYGLMAYAVEQRTQEIGIRMALGADGTRVVQTVLLDGLRPVLFGVMLGLAGALALSRVFSSLLFNVRSTDPATFVVSGPIEIAGALPPIPA